MPNIHETTLFCPLPPFTTFLSSKEVRALLHGKFKLSDSRLVLVSPFEPFGSNTQMCHATSQKPLQESRGNQVLLELAWKAYGTASGLHLLLTSEVRAVRVIIFQSSRCYR